MRSWLLRWDTVRDGGPSVLGVGRDAAPGVDSARHPDGTWCVTDGYLFDLPPGASPAARVLDSYRKRPDRMTDSLRGGASLAVWDPRARCLTMARDAMGIRPFFYAWRSGVLLASPSWAVIRAQPEISRSVNAQLAAEILFDRYLPCQIGESYLEDVARLPAAHSLRLVDGRIELDRYWDPFPDDFEWATEDEIRSFPRVFERAVGRCLDAGADCIALSGGVDSISIAVVASALRDDRPPLHALSLRMGERVGDESEVQRAVAEALGMPLTLRTLDECLEEAGPLAGARRLSADSPNPVMSLWQPAYTSLLGRGSQAGLSRLLVGTGGDETLDVDRTYAADRLASGDFRGFWRFVRTTQAGGSGSLPAILRQFLWTRGARHLFREAALRMTRRGSRPLYRRIEAMRMRRWLERVPWVEPERLLASQARESSEKPAGNDLGPYLSNARWFVQHPQIAMEKDQGATWGDSMGYQRFYPFWDRDLAGLLFRFHPERLLAGGRFKAPLRELVEQRLPGVEIISRKADFLPTVLELLRRDIPRTWREVRDDMELVRLGIAHEAGATDFMRRFLGGQSDNWVAAWLLMSSEIWLRAQAEPLLDRRTLC